MVSISGPIECVEEYISTQSHNNILIMGLALEMILEVTFVDFSVTTVSFLTIITFFLGYHIAY